MHGPFLVSLIFGELSLTPDQSQSYSDNLTTAFALWTEGSFWPGFLPTTYEAPLANGSPF
ncbi:hypothetical protein BN2475_70108 [Paraburkholderia ribeironis]|uniref:Uncharacterized protein n=1 Tax=Paraburkholderia ribeironis TaxID=1247936 RepID=A0A1N7RM09_9BURK|nr:hypothetical protein BN2475_70108 [Paraburkholderia ribeironis]